MDEILLKNFFIAHLALIGAYKMWTLSVHARNIKFSLIETPKYLNYELTEFGPRSFVTHLLQMTFIDSMQNGSHFAKFKLFRHILQNNS